MAIPSISNQLTPAQIKENEATASAFNARLKAQNEQINHNLGQADFFRILSAQLANQDPLNPMEDKEFIAQMASFSSLEEMKSMSNNMRLLSETVKLSQFSSAVSLIGKEATLATPNGTVTGTVSAVSGSSSPMLKINNDLYNISDLIEIGR